MYTCTNVRIIIIFFLYPVEQVKKSEKFSVVFGSGPRRIRHMCLFGIKLPPPSRVRRSIFFFIRASRVRDKRVNQSDKPGTCNARTRFRRVWKVVRKANPRILRRRRCEYYWHYFLNVGPSVSTRQTVVIRKFISSRPPLLVQKTPCPASLIR